MFCIPRLEYVYTISFHENSDLPPALMFVVYKVHSFIELCLLTPEFNYFRFTEL